jgi:hypothetical protein
MTDHNGVLMMQRVLLAGTLGMAMAQKAAAILEGRPPAAQGAQDGEGLQDDEGARAGGAESGFRESRGAEGFREPQGAEGAVLRAILDAANECLGHFDDRPARERWCDTLFQLLDLAAFATELSGRG